MKKAVSIVLFLALVTCAFSGCVEDRAVEPTPVPTPTLTPTPTPTPTLLPTPKPTPAIPPRTTPELSELGYLAKVVELLDQLIGITKRASNALDDYSDGKISLETVKYIQIACTEETYEVANEIASLKPPPKYEEHHRHFLKSANLKYSAMFELTLYFEDGDVNHLEKYKDLTEEAMRESSLAVLPT